MNGFIEKVHSGEVHKYIFLYFHREKMFFFDTHNSAEKQQKLNSRAARFAGTLDSEGVRSRTEPLTLQINSSLKVNSQFYLVRKRSVSRVRTDPRMFL